VLLEYAKASFERIKQRLRHQIAFAAETTKSWLILFARAVRLEPRLLLRLEPFDEYSEMRGNRRRERVVLVF
jgi:hypothetical protein